MTRAQLFNINDVVSFKRFVEIPNMNVTNTLLFLLIKCENPLHGEGFSHFINKNNCVFAYVVDINLTS